MYSYIFEKTLSGAVSNKATVKDFGKTMNMCSFDRKTLFVSRQYDSFILAFVKQVLKGTIIIYGIGKEQNNNEKETFKKKKLFNQFH